MRRSSHLPMCAALTIAMLLAAPCEAHFNWLRPVLYTCEPAGLEGYNVWRIYAEFSDPGDRLTGVFGLNWSPATITSSPGAFRQHPNGGNLAPNPALFAKFPTLQWDTFCTIGLAVNVEGAGQTYTSPGFPSLPVVDHTNMFWGTDVVNGLDQGAPDSAGRVLILQLTIPDNSSYMVRVGLFYRPAGTTDTVGVANQSTILLPLNPADVNGDFFVDGDDLALVILTWGETGEGIADIDDDGLVEVDDLVRVILNWGAIVTEICPVG